MKVRIRSRHPSHRPLRHLLNLPFRTLINFGRTDSSVLPRGRYVLINPPETVANAADKLLTKQKFTEHSVATAEYWPDFVVPENKFPVVVKHRWGSRGTGVYLMRTPADLAAFRARHGEQRFQSTYIIERFKNYRYEFRLHATQTKVFLSNRKARKDGVPETDRWKHTYENSVWYNRENPLFDPRHFSDEIWASINAEAVKAITALGMDFGAVDVKVNNEGKFFILEVNSAPSLGDQTRDHYLRLFPELAQHIKETRGRFIKS